MPIGSNGMFLNSKFIIIAQMKVHFIITGGTIDSTWDGTRDTAVVLPESVIPSYLEKIRLYNEVDFSVVFMKDSRDVNDEDRQSLLKIIEESPDKNFIVTHGTYTMPDTAKFIQSNLKRNDATIVLTGSMTPLKGFDMSDAGFNLGFAFSKAQDLEAGVYLCMNGRVFSAEEAAKSLSEGKFYSIFSEKQ